MDTLPLNHFLNLPRPPIVIGPPVGVPDTTTLAAHDFDVDTRTGFMPPKAPIERLPEQWAPWEDVLSDAIRSRLQLGDKPGLTEAEAYDSLRWRETVKNMPELSISDLKSSEVLLRRTHLVLAWIMHFYVHSLPPTEPVLIPSPLTLPLLQVSAELQLPPVITYSDDVLYNWRLIPPANPSTDHDGTFHSSSSDKDIPTISTIQCQTTFTSTPDEEEFYLSSARMELAGVAALDLMRSTMDEAWVGDDIAIRRITDNLVQLSSVIRRLRQLLLDVKNGCSPDVFYHQIRPWVRGADSATQSGRPWVFEGIDKDPSLEVPVELSGASAGQSALIHALDIFLGVEKYSHGKDLTGHSSPSSSSTSSSHSGSASTPNSHPLQAQAVSTSSSSPSSSPPSHAHQPQSHTDESSSSSPSPSNAEASTRKTAFLKRMQLYMPRHHRAFLTHLSNNPRPLRDLVFNAATSNNSSRTETPTQSQKDGQALLDAYNGAVMALKEFRDAHMIIVALYIIGPARRKDAALAAAGRETRGGDVSEYVGSGSTQQKGKGNEASAQPLKGTGGTDLVRFLKDVRDQTKNAVLNI